MSHFNDVVLPPVSDELVKALDELFPEKCPHIDQSERKIWIEAGKRELVKFIKEQHKRQTENILGG